MEVKSQLHVAIVLHLVPFWWEAGWALVPVLTLWRRENTLALAENLIRTTEPLVRRYARQNIKEYSQNRPDALKIRQYCFFFFAIFCITYTFMKRVTTGKFVAMVTRTPNMSCLYPWKDISKDPYRTCMSRHFPALSQFSVKCKTREPLINVSDDGLLEYIGLLFWTYVHRLSKHTVS